LLLAFDTATRLASIAVGTATSVAAEVTLGVTSRHSQNLLPAIDWALRQAGVTKDDITGIVIGAGPGSFTGVRIAAATAKGLVHALGVPLYAHSTLLAIASTAAQREQPVCAVLDARRGEVYAACYRFPGLGAPETLLAPSATTVENLLRDVAGLRPLFVGEGALRYRAEFEPWGAVAPPHLGLPRAAALLWLSGAAGTPPVENAARWEPSYLRESGAHRGIRG
jgi:tRNA threonylcarbamoyladenosine biosynthesis protein TsaB